jgi:hypothetical protein
LFTGFVGHGINECLAAGHELVDNGKDLGLDVGPWRCAVFGDCDVVEAQEDGRHAINVEQLRREWRGMWWGERGARVKVLEEGR